MSTTKNALPELPEWSKRDDLGGLVPSEIRSELRAYALAALASKQAPPEWTPEMSRAVQLYSELGAYAAANLSGAYGLFEEFWSVAHRAAVSSPAPAPLSEEIRRELIEDTREVFDAKGLETPQVVRDVIEYVDSWLTVYIQKTAERSGGIGLDGGM